MFPACEVVAVADQLGVEVLEAGAVYFALDAGLDLGHLRDLLQAAVPRSSWDRIALAGLYDDVVEQQRRLTIQALTRGPLGTITAAEDGAAIASVEQRAQQWLADEVVGFNRWQRVMAAIDAQPRADLAMLAVAVRSLSGLDSRQAA
jgi:NAD-specific glutamate dehydrogenase